MNNSLIQILEFIVQDIKKNYSLFDENNLLNAISQFQNNALDSRKKDNEINLLLNSLTLKDIIDYSKKLNISLLSPPNTKLKLIPLINALITQADKKSEFLTLIESQQFEKKKSKPKKKKESISISSSEYENLRKKWLTVDNIDKLEMELLKINMNLIREITKPWNLKPIGRTKPDLVEAILNKIKRIKGISKLGT